ncbi:unnamed protein product [Nippostrongylus brasiliensis]|uniref:Soluble calcium-activated nucleotidase 1 (inferred by orthology to a human protein) n=1 Tax=Nippostrongylus brasiliensis TaxID=27835 RepID=A0A0N4XT64_NIPBR|nr:unnamed protein product [Nippostrongylus brasiliensis]
METGALQVSVEWSEGLEELILNKTRLKGSKGFEGKQLLVHEKSGKVYEIVGDKAFVRQNLNKPDLQKIAPKWWTVKDGNLYVGSTGMRQGNNTHVVKRVSSDGKVVEDLDWTEEYYRIRKGAGYGRPEGKNVIYERYDVILAELIKSSKFCGMWKWVGDMRDRLLFRSIWSFGGLLWSPTPPSTGGARVLLTADADLQNVEVLDIRSASDRTRGFRDFVFLPKTFETVIVALKVTDVPKEDATCFITVLDIFGNVILDDVPIPGDYQFKGLYLSE